MESCGPWFPGRLTFYRKRKQILRQCHESDAENAFIHTAGDNYRTTVTFEGNAGENLYGLGQEQQGWFDRKGGAYQLMHWNTKSTIPYLYSSLSYGFLWNNPAPDRVEATKNHTLWSADSCDQADYLVMVGDTPAMLQRPIAT